MRSFVLLLLLAPLAQAGDPKIFPPDAKVEKLWSEGTFTEGPIYGPGHCVYFSDIGNRILKFDPKTGKTSEFRNPSGKSNGLEYDAKGRLIACEGAAGGNRRVSVTEADGTVKALADNWMGKKFNSPNDLIVDLKGRVYFTDPRYSGPEPKEIKTESVYRIDPDGKVTQLITDVDRPNGIVLSPDMKTLFLADNVAEGKRHLLSFPLNDDGSVGAKKILFDFAPDRGIDGMAIDKEGRIFATAGKGTTSGVHVFTPDGKKIAFIHTPETATNCCFAGSDHKMLYITAGRSLYRVPTLCEGFSIYWPK